MGYETLIMLKSAQLPMATREAPGEMTFVKSRKLLLRVLRFVKGRLLPLRTHYWEYLGRLELVSTFLASEASPSSTVLDVGGAPGDNLLRKFGIQNVTTLDLDPRADIVASATKIPCADDAFDFVTCIDTMEHVPQSQRLAVMQELVRVAKRAVVIVAPQDTPANREAEKWVLHYTGNRFLKEHAINGLWDVPRAEEQLRRLESEGRIARFEKREFDDLLLWACLMTEDFANSSEIYGKLRNLEHRLHARHVAMLIWKP